MSQPPWEPTADLADEARRRADARKRRRAELADARAYGVRIRNRAKLARLANRAPGEGARRPPPTVLPRRPGA